MDLLERLIGHDRWTTDRLLEICRDFPPADWDRKFDIGHGTLRLTFEHFLLARRSWVDLMVGTPGRWMQDEPLPDQPYEELRARNHDSAHRLETFARQVVDEDRLDERFTDAYGIEHTFGATILQVTLHAHAHRADILAMLNSMGIDQLPDGDPQEWEWVLRNASS